MMTTILLFVLAAQPPNIWEVCIVVESRPKEETAKPLAPAVQPEPDRGKGVGPQQPQATQDDGLLPQPIQTYRQTPARRMVAPLRVRCSPFG